MGPLASTSTSKDLKQDKLNATNDEKREGFLEAVRGKEAAKAEQTQGFNRAAEVEDADGEELPTVATRPSTATGPPRPRPPEGPPPKRQRHGPY